MGLKTYEDFINNDLILINFGAICKERIRELAVPIEIILNLNFYSPKFILDKKLVYGKHAHGLIKRLTGCC